MRVAIDPGAATPGAAAVGRGSTPDAVYVWCWRVRSVEVLTTADTTLRTVATGPLERGHAEAVIADVLGAGAEVALEGLYQPRGAYQRRRSSIGSILVLAEHCGALLAALRPVSVVRPTCQDWRPRVGIPAGTEARRAGGLAIEVAERHGWRFRGSVAVQEAAAEAVCIYLATWGRS